VHRPEEINLQPVKGEAIEVTDRGRRVAILSPAPGGNPEWLPDLMGQGVSSRSRCYPTSATTDMFFTFFTAATMAGLLNQQARYGTFGCRSFKEVTCERPASLSRCVLEP
jgi:hypothetical protein